MGFPSLFFLFNYGLCDSVGELSCCKCIPVFAVTNFGPVLLHEICEFLFGKLTLIYMFLVLLCLCVCVCHCSVLGH